MRLYLRYGLAASLGFAIPISLALTNSLLAIALVVSIADRKLRQRWISLIRHPLIRWVALWIGLMLIGITYTVASWDEIFEILKKYKEIFFIPLFLVIFFERKCHYFALYGFLAAIALTLLLSYWMALTGSSLGIIKGTVDNPYVFKTHITQGLLVALAAYWWLDLAVWRGKWMMLNGLVVFLAIFNVLFMIQGRTGYLIVAALALLFLGQRYQWRGVLLGMMAVPLFIVVSYHASHSVQGRVNQAIHGVENYQQGEVRGSTALRLNFYKNSLLLIKQSPWWGMGTGSFNVTYQQLITGTAQPATDNPHNEYLLIMVQWGLIGLLIFLYILIRLWQLTAVLPLSTSRQAQGLLIAFAIGCLVNSLLLDFTEGHLFALFVGILYAHIPAQCSSNQ